MYEINLGKRICVIGSEAEIYENAGCVIPDTLNTIPKSTDIEISLTPNDVEKFYVKTFYREDYVFFNVDNEHGSFIVVSDEDSFTPEYPWFDASEYVDNMFHAKDGFTYWGKIFKQPTWDEEPYAITPLDRFSELRKIVGNGCVLKVSEKEHSLFIITKEYVVQTENPPNTVNGTIQALRTLYGLEDEKKEFSEMLKDKGIAEVDIVWCTEDDEESKELEKPISVWFEEQIKME